MALRPSFCTSSSLPSVPMSAYEPHPGTSHRGLSFFGWDGIARNLSSRAASAEIPVARGIGEGRVGRLRFRQVGAEDVVGIGVTVGGVTVLTCAALIAEGEDVRDVRFGHHPLGPAAIGAEDGSKPRRAKLDASSSTDRTTVRKDVYCHAHVGPSLQRARAANQSKAQSGAPHDPGGRESPIQWREEVPPRGDLWRDVRKLGHVAGDARLVGDVAVGWNGPVRCRIDVADAPEVAASLQSPHVAGQVSVLSVRYGAVR